MNSGKNPAYKPLITVVIPVLNEKNNFERTIKSIVQQSHKNIEIIVIDGGSKDGTLESINKYNQYISYWETGLDSGIADAFNRGINKSNGQLIAILNSADTWLPNTISTVIKYFNDNQDADIFFGSVRYYDPKNNYTYIRRPNLDALPRRMSIFHPSLFVNSKCYKKIGLYLPEFTHAMDSEWVHRAIEQKAEFVEIPEILSQMELGGISDKEYVKSLKQYKNSVILHGLSSKTHAHLHYGFYLLLKILFNLKLFRPLKLARDKILHKKI